MNTKKQKTLMRDSTQSRRVKPKGSGSSADVFVLERISESPMESKELMEEICKRINLQAALKRIKSNGGVAGADGMTVDELPTYLKSNWFAIKEKLLTGSYVPQPVRRVEIPKPNGKGKRKLGIPTVVDRFIQQAILQILQRGWDSTFSDHSYGFRPKRSCHQAIAKAQTYLEAGYEWVVDIDLEKFFDQVNHDRLMSTLAKRLQDKRLLKLLRAYLNAGVMEHGLVSPTTEGTPQGGPLSPLLSNIVLDELDKELEKRGHQFVRYADDCNIYVKSERAGKRVMESISRFIIRKLRLRVNLEKSAVDKPSERKFLGFSFTRGKAPNRRKIASESIKRFRIKMRGLTNRNWSISMENRLERISRYLVGWRGYFGYCQTPSVLGNLDSWIRCRLRSAYWKQWKVYGRRWKELVKLGVRKDLAKKVAWSSKGSWRISHSHAVQIALSNAYFDLLGLPRLAPC
jgi:RNA-directed DNA polymerase